MGIYTALSTRILCNDHDHESNNINEQYYQISSSVDTEANIEECRVTFAKL